MALCSIVTFRDKKYLKSPKRDYRERSRERYSNGGSRRRDYGNERDKEYYNSSYGSSYDKDKYSVKQSSRNGSRRHHKSRR